VAVKGVFDAGPLITACKSEVNGKAVIDYLAPVTPIAVAPSVQREVTAAGSRYPDAAVANARIRAGKIAVESPVPNPELASVLALYGLGAGECESVLLASHKATLDPTTALVVDDVLAYVVCDRLKVNKLLFLDFLVALAQEGLLSVADARAIARAVQRRYPKGFVDHTLRMLAGR